MAFGLAPKKFVVDNQAHYLPTKVDDLLSDVHGMIPGPIGALAGNLFDRRDEKQRAMTTAARGVPVVSLGQQFDSFNAAHMGQQFNQPLGD